MKAPSTEVKSNSHRVKTHWSVYAHYLLWPMVIIGFLTLFLIQIKVLKLDLGLTIPLLVLLSWAGLILTKPVVIPDDTIDEQVKYAHKALKSKKVIFIF